MISGVIVRIAYWLNSSKKYKNTKHFFDNILNNSDYPYKKYLDTLMIFLILTSVGILVYEVRHPVPEWMDFYDIYMVTILFLIEYILRLWVYSDLHTSIVHEYEDARFLKKKFSLWRPLRSTVKTKIEYISSPTAIIDLLAILPAYRPLRILRIFVLFRVFKLLRYTKSINQFVEVLVHKRFELFTLLFLLLFIMISSGIAIYVFEENENPGINSLFDALYWSLVTISTVGYGDISPVTDEGKVVSMLIIVSGLAMISFVTSVIVTAFSEKLGELKESRMIEMVNKSDEFLIICGFGQMATMFLRQNEKIGHKYVIIDKEIQRVEEARKEGYHAIHDDASRYEVISKFNIKYANITVLCLTASDIENIYIALNVKSLSPRIRVIARAIDESMKKKYELAGVDYVLHSGSIANLMVQTAVFQPILYNGIHALLAGEDVAHIDEIRVTLQSGLVDRKVQEVGFRESKLLLIGIQREGNFMFSPGGETALKENDILLLMGLKVSISYLKEKYRQYWSVL